MRKNRRSSIDTSTRAPLRPGMLLPDMIERGWRVVPTRSGRSWDAERRAADGGGLLGIVEEFRVSDRAFLCWVGVSSRWRPWQALRRVFSNPLDAIREIEMADEGSPLASCWENQNGPPERAGWTHIVRQYRDVWHRLTPENVPLIVFQTPARLGLRYNAAIAGDTVTRDGAPQLWDCPDDAMEEAEREARRRGLVVPYLPERERV